MNSKTKKDYRLASHEASQLNPEQIVERVVWRIMEDAPDIGDSEAMGKFLGTLSRPQVAAYAAWETSNWVVVGGAGHVFEMCSAPLIYAAMSGYELLGEPRLAANLRRLSRMFPGGKVPDDRDQAAEFIYSRMERDQEMAALLEEFEKRKVEDWFDVPKFLETHRESFVTVASEDIK